MSERQDQPANSTALAPLERTLTGKTRELREVAERRDQREVHAQVEGVSGGALQRLSEITAQPVSLQRVVGWGGDVAKDAARHVLAPLTPQKAPGNTPWARALRRFALRGMVDGVYRCSGELVHAGTSDNLLEQAVELGHDLHDLDAHGVRLQDSKLRGLKARGGDFRASWMSSVDMSGADLEGARFSRSKMVGVFDKSTYRPDAYPVRFCQAKLMGADFRKAIVTGVDFTGADLTGADFTQASFNPIKRFKDPGDAKFATVISLTGIGAFLLAVTGDYKKMYQRIRHDVRFDGAKLDGVRFSVDAPFDQFKLSETQRKAIVLVDRKGHVRDDLQVGRDGSLMVVPVAAKEHVAIDAPKPAGL